MSLAIADPLPVKPRLPTDRDFGFGPQLLQPNGVRFRLWAPLADSFDLVIKGEAISRPMRKEGEWFRLDVPSAGPGTLYNFALPDGSRYPDPASRFQPYDAKEWSEVIDPEAFPWTDQDWNGRPWEEAVIYEMHVGTFTPQGTYRAATDRLDHLARIGITAIELMPLADFPGRWNWGYDGVLLYAPDASYGTPDDLRAFIDAAHARGIMVFLDVVYNHLGPEGNYLADYSHSTSSKHDTPWGKPFNFDEHGSPQVRRYVRENAIYWHSQFHIDGLRFDSIHSIEDDSSKSFVEELAEGLHEATRGRHFHLIVENAKNDVDPLARDQGGHVKCYTAQWNDDLHHALHATATGEDRGYYADFAGRLDRLGRALAEGFAFQGEQPKEQDEPKGEPSGFLPSTAFVSYIQNHDQVGNRPLGDRIAALVPKQVSRATTAIHLLAPQVPMLFMGQEWGSTRQFLFFSDLDEAHRKKTRELHSFEAKNAPEVPEGKRVPDPFDDQSFSESQLAWAELEDETHREWVDFHSNLLAVRRREIVPRLRNIGPHSGEYRVLGHRAVEVVWRLGDGTKLQLLANLGNERLEGCDPWRGRNLWLEGFASGTTLEGWSLVWNLLDEDRGGR